MFASERIGRVTNDHEVKGQTEYDHSSTQAVRSKAWLLNKKNDNKCNCLFPK